MKRYSIPPNAVCDATERLTAAFDRINADLFYNTLIRPNINVCPTSRIYIKYTPAVMCCDTVITGAHITATTGTLSMTLPDLCTLLLREMVHIHCDTVQHIAAVTYDGEYYNRLFASACVPYGLICTKANSRGYKQVTPAPYLADYLARIADLLTEQGVA